MGEGARGGEMGYTHYYRQRRDMTPEEFEGFSQDVAALRAALPKTVGQFDERYGFGGYELGGRSTPSSPLEIAHDDPSSPIMGEGWVHFNGSGYPDADHESFRVERAIDRGHWSFKEGEDLFNCTKTAMKPYDAMVCACLLALMRRAPGAWRVSSDGEAGNWVAAARFAREALGKAMPLSSVSGFSKCKEDLAAARQPSQGERVKREARILERASKRGKKPAGGPRAL